MVNPLGIQDRKKILMFANWLNSRIIFGRDGARITLSNMKPDTLDKLHKYVSCLHQGYMMELQFNLI